MEDKDGEENEDHNNKNNIKCKNSKIENINIKNNYKHVDQNGEKEKNCILKKNNEKNKIEDFNNTQCSTNNQEIQENYICNACNYCDDICSYANCKKCLKKKISLYEKKKIVSNSKKNESYIIKKLKNYKEMYCNLSSNELKDDEINIEEYKEKDSIEMENNEKKGINDQMNTYNYQINGIKKSNSFKNTLNQITKHNFLKNKKKFTICEVRRHNKIDDCWLIANGNVYDVTNIISHHPGGMDCILKKAGTDVSIDFAYHSKYAQKYYWQALKIGELVKCRKEILEAKKKKSNICKLM